MPGRRKPDPEVYFGLAGEDSGNDNITLASHFEDIGEEYVEAVMSISNEDLRKRLASGRKMKLLNWNLVYGPRLGSVRAILALIMEMGEMTPSDAWKEFGRLICEALDHSPFIGSWEPLAWRAVRAWGNG